MASRRPKKRRSAAAPGPALRSHVELSIGGHPVAVEALVPAGPTRPRHMLPLFRELANAVVGRAVAATHERGETISCRAGCGACCRQLVPITPAEAHFFGQYLRRLPQPGRRRILARFADARERLEAAGLLEILLDPQRVKEEEKEEIALRYFALSIPCPFLEAESCSIHPDRPIACREYLVTSEPEHCAAPRADTIVMVPLAGEVSRAVARVDVDGDAPTPWVALVIAPDWSRDHPDEAPARPAPEIVERLVTRLVPSA